MVERSIYNRLIVGSNPTTCIYLTKERIMLWLFGLTAVSSFVIGFILGYKNGAFNTAAEFRGLINANQKNKK